MPLSFIYTGWNPESQEIEVTINGKDYRGHLNPYDVAEFERILSKRGNSIDALNYLKNRTMGGLKQVNDRPLNESAEIEGKLQKFYQLSTKIASLNKEIKKLQASMGGLEEDITAELERAEGNVIETKKFFARIQRKGYERETPKYKEAFDFILAKVNPALKKIAEEALVATKTLTRIKPQIAVGQQGQPMMEGMLDKIKNILNQIVNRMKSSNNSIEQALAKVQQITESKTMKLEALIDKAEAEMKWDDMKPVERKKMLSQFSKVLKNFSDYSEQAFQDLPYHVKVLIWSHPKGTNKK